MSKRTIEVALYEPEIPQNTGNIGRLCVGFNIRLSLIGKLGFSLDQKNLRRAGLDYWPNLKWKHYQGFQSFYEEKKNHRIYLLSTKAQDSIYTLQHEDDRPCCFLFGKETAGFPEELRKEYALPRYHLPILGPIRSYNLANSVAMTISEMHRRSGYFK